MEGIGYTLIYLARGELPWQGIKADTKKEKYNKIMDKKCDTPIEMLCKGLPNEFTAYMYYCRSLQFEDKPDYVMLRKQFNDGFYRNHLDKGFSFDWIRLGVDLDSCKKGENNDSNRASEEQHEEHKVDDRRSRDVSNAESQVGDRFRSADAKRKHSLNSQEQLQVVRQVQNGRKARMSIPTPNIKLTFPIPAEFEDAKKIEEKQDESSGSSESGKEEDPAAAIQQIVQGLPKVVLRIAKEAKERKQKEKEEEKSRGAETEQKEEGKAENGTNKKPATLAVTEPQQARMLDDFVAATSKAVRLEDKMKDVPLEVLSKKLTSDLSDRSSCNFRILDIVENSTLFGTIQLVLITLCG